MGTLVATVLATVAISFGTADAAPKEGGPGNGRGRDKLAPTIVCPDDITVDAMAPIGAYVKYSVTVTDNKDPSPRVTYSHPPGTFPIGTTTVTVTATDASNNSSTCTFDVAVNEPAVGSFHYKIEWWAWDYDALDVVWYAWSITVSADGTVSGSGEQIYMLEWYPQWWEEYASPLPDGLSGSGSVSGTISPDGSSELDLSYNYWYWESSGDYYAGEGPYTESTFDFSGTTQAFLDAYGNLHFSGGGYYGYWVKD